MSPRSQEQYRRLQIGGIGLTAVILLVVLAGILSDRNLPDGSAASPDQVTAEQHKNGAGSEPLSELGVQPAPSSEGSAAPQPQGGAPSNAAPNAPQPVNGANTNALPPTLRPGERAPDLPSSSPTAQPAQ